MYVYEPQSLFEDLADSLRSATRALQFQPPEVSAAVKFLADASMTSDKLATDVDRKERALVAANELVRKRLEGK